MGADPQRSAASSYSLTERVTQFVQERALHPAGKRIWIFCLTCPQSIPQHVAHRTHVRQLHRST